MVVPGKFLVTIVMQNMGQVVQLIHSAVGMLPLQYQVLVPTPNPHTTLNPHITPSHRTTVNQLIIRNHHMQDTLNHLITHSLHTQDTLNHLIIPNHRTVDRVHFL